jgi:selenocysteine lyase/cysteine desulfurase
MDKLIANEFNLLKEIIYLNHAGVSPWPYRTSKAVQNFAEENMLSGSFNYTMWLGIESQLRRRTRKLINAPSEYDIAFLKNTSEALSVVAYGQEFPSNRIVWESLAQKGVEFREADLNNSKSPEDALFSLADNKTRLITISSVQYSTGLKMNLNLIGEFCKSRGILFCVDAIQSLGAMRFDVQQIQADFVMADGHKWMLGPEGLAVFYSLPDARDRLHLHQYGWHMVEDAGNFDIKNWSTAKNARRFECGSPNMLGIYALNASLSLLLESGMVYVEKEILKRSEYLIDKIKTVPELELITPISKGRYSGIITFRRRDVESEPLYQYLMKNRVVCAFRSGGIRLSPHFYTPYEDLDQAIELVMSYSS